MPGGRLFQHLNGRTRPECRSNKIAADRKSHIAADIKVPHRSSPAKSHRGRQQSLTSQPTVSREQAALEFSTEFTAAPQQPSLSSSSSSASSSVIGTPSSPSAPPGLVALKRDG
jgi:hypothetical protein